MLSPGDPSPPRFLFGTIESGRFQCVLTMPKNCPIREDIIVRMIMFSQPDISLEFCLC